MYSDFGDGGSYCLATLVSTKVPRWTWAVIELQQRSSGLQNINYIDNDTNSDNRHNNNNHKKAGKYVCIYIYIYTHIHIHIQTAVINVYT